MSELETYIVPVIDPDTGDGWDILAEAETPTEAMRKAQDSTDKRVHISRTFVEKHLEIDHP